MYKNLKIQERLKKCFTVVALLASIAGVIGAIMIRSINMHLLIMVFRRVISERQ